jgi:hypothetical protein
MPGPDAQRRLSLQPTELQPHETQKSQSRLSALEDLREDIAAVSQLEPADPMFSAHLGLALLKIAHRLEQLERPR